MMFKRLLKYKSVLILIPALFSCLQSLLAQQPNWEVDPSRYTNSMVVIGALKFDRIESKNTEDKIAAFINGECRGLVQPMYVKELGRYLAYLMIYSNESSGTISFKMYNESEGKIVDGVKKLDFEVDGLIGNVGRPFVWSDVELNSEAKIISFSFPEQVKPAVFEDDELWLEVKPGTNPVRLKPSFTLSTGAVAMVNGKMQAKASTEQDFTEPVVYKVRSEDEQVFEEFIVHVIQKEEVLPVTNFISPNEDGFNDIWEIKDIQLYKGFSLRVFDKNGSLVFFSSDYANEWKGQNYRGETLPNGIYYYHFKDASFEYKGTVQLYK